MKYKILGLSGSPVKKGNVETLLNRALENLPAKNMEYDIVHLSGLEINDCIHCNFCLKKQKPGKYCSMKDDAQGIFEKAETADIIVLASPVYFMRSSARMLALIDRFRVFVFGNLTAGRMKNKIGVSMAAAWLRNGGIETTHMTHILAFLTLEMIPASSHQGISPLGASILTSTSSPENSKPASSLGMEDDGQGLLSAQLILQRAVDLVKLTGK
ncbi:MAG: flavodoxin family protein [Smithella sp.]